ncbi:SDR family oxidoreductase [Mitsuaria sp. WAJ17]|uniref:SDR family oxidoreductase n=1 Tax=Mitsuaria sp. WAJ17 TaxID=2761452 RepID=UPI001603F07E|nr:SDR family oxidoreductase [Mitsuaria sp. WAJ17]MBB2486181.1 SDR family oxidoreductase [Mitsuaria sp. WAJ17]
MACLADKVALVTGASSGIGRAAALAMAREAVAEEIRRAGGQALALAGDVQNEAYAQALVGQAVSAYGGLDIAFNNAGTLGAMGESPSITREDWDTTLAINLSSAFLAAKHQIPAMLRRGQGSVIFTSTFVGYTVGFPGMAAYAASKSGLLGLTQALAAEFGARGIRVNALLPGGTDTPMGRQLADTEDKVRHVSDLHALKRLATPEEIAGTVLYLASEASSFTTGAALLVDGGVSITRT